MENNLNDIALIDGFEKQPSRYEDIDTNIDSTSATGKSSERLIIKNLESRLEEMSFELVAARQELSDKDLMFEERIASIKIENERFLTLERLVQSCSERYSSFENDLRTRQENKSIGTQTNIVEKRDSLYSSDKGLDKSINKSLEFHQKEMSNKLDSVRKQRADDAGDNDKQIASIQIKHDRFHALEENLHSGNERCSMLESFLQNPPMFSECGTETSAEDILITTIDSSSATDEGFDFSATKSLKSRLEEISSELVSTRQQLSDQALAYDDLKASMQIENNRFHTLEDNLESTNEMGSMLESDLRNLTEYNVCGTQTSAEDIIISTRDSSSATDEGFDFSATKSLESRLEEISSELASAKQQLSDQALAYDDRIASMQIENDRFHVLERLLQSCDERCSVLESDLRKPVLFSVCGTQTKAKDIIISTRDSSSATNEGFDFYATKSLESRLEEISSELASARQQLSDQAL
ncbi:unnamed protein product, partial [Protopolystoma xenopodis]